MNLKYTIWDSLKDVFSVFGRSNWLSLVAGIAVVAYIGLREIEILYSEDEVNGFVGFYKTYCVAYWVAAYVAFLFAFSVAINRTKNHPHSKPIKQIFGAYVIVTPLIILLLAYFRLDQYKEAFTYIASVSAAIVSFGLLMVKQQQDAHNRKVDNTLKTLMDMRMSEVYQNNVDTVNKIYPGHTTPVSRIPEADIDAMSSKEEHPEYKLTSDQVRAIKAQAYILNYFEFLALGCKNHILDEELLFNSLGFIVITNYERAENLILAYSDGKTFSLIKEMYTRWKKRREEEILVIKKRELQTAS